MVLKYFAGVKVDDVEADTEVDDSAAEVDVETEETELDECGFATAARCVGNCRHIMQAAESNS